MYKSPIDVIYQSIESKFENGIISAVQNCDIIVDKDELVRALQYDREQYEKGYADGRAHPEWTPCSERLPEKGQICLVCGKNGGMYVARLWKDDKNAFWTKTGTGKFVYPVAWMPLPRPWKGEEL